MKLMSFSITLPQFLLGMKSVTRRAGWRGLRADDRLIAVDRVMGLGPGEKPLEIGPIEVLSVRREGLDAITDAEAVLEGFPDFSGAEFAARFGSVISDDDGMVTRIEFRPISRDGIGAIGSRVNARKGKGDIPGTIIGHVPPGEHPAALGSLIADSLSLMSRPPSGAWRPSSAIRAMVLKSDGKLSVMPAKYIRAPTKTTIAADIVFEHTTSARIRELAGFAQRMAPRGAGCCLAEG